MGNKEFNRIDKEDNNYYSDNENCDNYTIKKSKTNCYSKNNKMNRSIDCIINKDKNYYNKKKIFNFNKKNNKTKKFIPSQLNKILQKNKENIIIHGLKFAENDNINNFSLNFFFYNLNNNKQTIIFDYEKDNPFFYSNLNHKDLINLYNDYKDKVTEENKKIYTNFLINDKIVTRTGRASSSNQDKEKRSIDTITIKTPVQEKLFKKTVESKSNEKNNISQKNINNRILNDSIKYSNGYKVLNTNKNYTIKNTIFKIKNTNSFDKNIKRNISEDKKILMIKVKTQKVIFNSITNKSEIENYQKQDIYKGTNDDKRVDTPHFNSTGVQKYYQKK